MVWRTYWCSERETSGDSHMHNVNIKGWFKYVLVNMFLFWQLLPRWSVCLFDNLQVHNIRMRSIRKNESITPTCGKAGEESSLMILKHLSLGNTMQKRAKHPTTGNLAVKDTQPLSSTTIRKTFRAQTHIDQRVPLPVLSVCQFSILQSP